MPRRCLRVLLPPVSTGPRRQRCRASGGQSLSRGRVFGTHKLARLCPGSSPTGRPGMSADGRGWGRRSVESADEYRVISACWRRLHQMCCNRRDGRDETASSARFLLDRPQGVVPAVVSMAPVSKFKCGVQTLARTLPLVVVFALPAFPAWGGEPGRQAPRILMRSADMPLYSQRTSSRHGDPHVRRIGDEASRGAGLLRAEREARREAERSAPVSIAALTFLVVAVGAAARKSAGWAWGRVARSRRTARTA